ncbi:MAG: protease inhibitor I42 family protein [Luteimonas sp.]|nr:protease inhibitor I42 family protein [Luteimonas sp.]
MKPLALALILLAGTACSAPDPNPDAAPPPASTAPQPGAAAEAAGPPPSATPEGEPAPTVVQATGGTTTLAVGQVLEIALEGNAGTGYAWEFEADGAPQLQRAPAQPAPDAVQADGPRLVGGPTTQRWHFRAEQPGATTVKLVYRRPWEKDVAPAREASFAVVVDEAPAR